MGYRGASSPVGVYALEVPLCVEIPGRPTLELRYLLLDMNGTLTARGVLLPGVEERLQRLAQSLELRLLSADTFATLEHVAAHLDVNSTVVPDGQAKLDVVAALGAGSCAAIGNGANDAAMLAEAAIGIAVIGPEGAAAAALAAADLITRSIHEALDLLLDPRALAATLRS